MIPRSVWPVQSFLRDTIDTSAARAQVDVHNAYLLFEAGRLKIAVALL